MVVAATDETDLMSLCVLGERRRGGGKRREAWERKEKRERGSERGEKGGGRNGVKDE